MKSRSQVLLSVLCITLCLSSIALGKTKKSAAGGNGQDQVKAMLEQSRQAALKGDSSYLEQNAADDYIRVSSVGGKVMSKTDAISALKNGDAKYESIQPGDYTIHVYGDAAVASYAVDVKGTYKGQDMSGHNQVTRMFVKRGGKWQEVAFHSSKAAS